jgi:hypothetical protein
MDSRLRVWFRMIGQSEPGSETIETPQACFIVIVHKTVNKVISFLVRGEMLVSGGLFGHCGQGFI